MPTIANSPPLCHQFKPGEAEFLYAGEACYDWELEAYELSYHRSEITGYNGHEW